MIRLGPDQRGFSLPELLMATALGVVVLMTAVELYATAREVERIERGHARVLEQAKLARHLVTDALRKAGHPGDDDSEPLTPAIIPAQSLTIRHHQSTVRFFTAPAIGQTDVHSLYRRRDALGGQREELVTGIEGLAVRYGISRGDDATLITFKPASQVRDASQIIAVEVRFEVTDIHGGAPRLRYPVTLVVALRNSG